MTELDSKGSFRKFEDAVIDGAERKAAAIVVEAEQYRQSELRAASQGSGAAELERKRQELLTDKLSQNCRETVFRYKLGCSRPLLVTMPDRHSGDDAAVDIKRYISEAVGIHI